VKGQGGGVATQANNFNSDEMDARKKLMRTAVDKRYTNGSGDYPRRVVSKEKKVKGGDWENKEGVGRRGRKERI